MNVSRTPAAPFDLAALAAALGETACRYDADAVAECDSTNSRVMAAAEAGAPSGTVLVAERQTAGRGRRGRSWFSAPGDSLTFSVLWRFAAASAAPAALSLAVGLAIARACEALGGTGIGLKWPNDLLHDGRKLAGILIELVPAEPRAAVIGIGLNLRLPADLPDELGASAAALDQFLPTVPAAERVLAQLLQSLAATLDVYAEQGFAALRQDWLARDAYRGRPVRILSEFGADRHGLCAGVDADGALLLDTAAGRERLISGEISLRPGP